MDEEQAQSPAPSSLPDPSADAAPSTSTSSTSLHLHQQSETPPTTTEVQVEVLHPDGDTVDQQQQQQQHRLRRRSRSHRVNLPIPNASLGDISDDAWYFLAVIVTFWFFASMTVILGFYGSFTLKLGPNSSQLITDNQLFVQSIQVQQIEGIPGPMLYGFHTIPALDVETTWTDVHRASIQPSFHKEWVYNLNAGSKLDISYNVKKPSSSPMALVIAQGEESFLEWIDYPFYPNTTLSWNIVHGSGRIEQEITESDTYYIAVGNLNPEAMEVELNLTVKALLYNTTQAHSRCSLYNNVCSFSFMFLKKNVVILASPGPEQVKNDDGWYVLLSYGPRWLTFIIGLGILAIMALLGLRFWNMFQSYGDSIGTQSETEDDNQEPLLSPKEDDLSSLGSSYDSVSTDGEDLEERLPEGGKPLKEGESATNLQKLCVICFDSPRDCFFLPCGHCAACFACGSRIAEEAGTCPICRRRMKKVRKIYSV